MQGEGEHHFYYIEKHNATTDQIARQLAKALRIPANAVSYSGRKDKVALTRQWFCAHRPGKALVDAPELAQARVLEASLHNRKLKTGSHRSNRFAVQLRGDLDEGWQQRWQQLKDHGAANYFGEQRFGIANLDKASAWFAGDYKAKRYEQGMLLSAVRSQLFNEYLAARLSQHSMLDVMVGDVMLLGTSRSGFVVTEAQLADAKARVSQQDIHPSGPMFGVASGLQPTDESLALEQSVLDKHPRWQQGLIGKEVKAARRSLRMLLTDASMVQNEQGVLFQFSLPAGAFATSVIAQITEFTDVSRAKYSTDK